MAKSVQIQVAKDHLDRLTKANGTSALMELIWNSLDADAKNIEVRTINGSLGVHQKEGKPVGEIIKKKNLTVLVKKWIDVLSDAEARYQYLKEKLNYSISVDEEGINLLKKKYAEYLPVEA